MRKLDIKDYDNVCGGLFAGDAGMAIIYQINGPNDSAGSDTRSNNNGGSANVTYNADGSVKSVQVNCPPGTVPSIGSGAGSLNLGAGALGRVVNGSGAIGGNGASITCKDRR